MMKPQETQAYKTYILNYNVMYHDYHMSDEAIEAELGPEPVRFADELTEIARDFDEELEWQRELDAVYADASNRRGY